MNKSYNMNIDTGEKTWLTPPEIINALGQFDIDPCCPPTMPWRTATHMVHWPEDGLKVDWTGQRVWLNPPYGREAVPFLRKIAAHEGGGYLAHICPHRHLGMAGLDIPQRLRHPVSSRTAPLLPYRRNARRDGYRAICARRVLRTGLCPSAQRGAYRRVFARIMKGA